MSADITTEYRDPVRRLCPDCPDGQVWDSRGPTGETCQTCSGAAWIWADEEGGES